MLRVLSLLLITALLAVGCGSGGPVTSAPQITPGPQPTERPIAIIGPTITPVQLNTATPIIIPATKAPTPTQAVVPTQTLESGRPPDAATAQDAIIGEWQLLSGDMCSYMKPTAGSNTVVFFKSGSVSLGTLASTYTWSDDEHIQITPAPGVFGCILQVKIDGDRLILTGGMAGTHTLARKSAQTPPVSPLNRDAIIGEWQLLSGDMCSFMTPTEGSNTVIFFESGSVSLGTFASTYTWADDEHIQIALAPGVIGCVLGVGIDGDRLILTGGMTGTHTLVRKE